MTDTGLEPLGFELDQLAARLEPGERRKLGRAIGTDLRAANAKRIKANVTPEGEPMAPRKSGGTLRAGATRKSGKAKKAAMFRRASAPRYLRRETSESEIQVGFAGAMARIMRVHHYGLRDTVTRDPSSPEVTYPARPVIGLTPDDRLRILEKVVAQVDG